MLPTPKIIDIITQIVGNVRSGPAKTPFVIVAAWKGYADSFLMYGGSISEDEYDQRNQETRRRILELDPNSGIVDGWDARVMPKP